MEILKRDGSREPFQAEKLRLGIVKCLADVHIAGAEGKEIAERIVKDILNLIKGKDMIESSQLREEVLNGFRDRAKKAEQEWLNYEKEHKE